MKGIDEQTYYEILEVNPAATSKEIQRAYEHAKETFHTDSLAVYSLFSEQEIQEIQVAIQEAYRVLTDETLRKRYDQSHYQILGQQKLRLAFSLKRVRRAGFASKLKTASAKPL